MTDLSKTQLATILSALTAESRNPANRDAALKAIDKQAMRLGVSLDELLASAAGLLDGRLDAAAWLAELSPQERPQAPTGEPVAPDDLVVETAALRTRIAKLERQLAERPSRAQRPAAQSRQGTKEERVVGLLRRPEGATLAQIVEATGWQPHTVRGAFAGALKKKRGLAVTSTKEAGGERVYRIAAD